MAIRMKRSNNCHHRLQVFALAAWVGAIACCRAENTPQHETRSGDDVLALCKAVAKNDDYFSRARIVFTETGSTPSHSTSRTGTLTYCGDYFSCVSTYEKEGKACCFVGTHGYARWDASDSVAVETSHPGRSASEISAGVQFGRSGPPFIRWELCGEGHKRLPDFLEEQAAQGATISVSPGESATKVITIQGKPSQLGTWTYTFGLRHRQDCAAVTSFRSLHDRRLITEYTVNIDDTKDPPFLLPQGRTWSTYGLPGVDPDDPGRVTSALITGVLTVKSLTRMDASSAPSDFGSESLMLPAGVRLMRHQADGSIAVLDSLGEGRLKEVEVRAPDLKSFDSPTAVPTGSRAKLARFLQILSVTAAAVAAALFLRSMLSNKNRGVPKQS